MNSLSWMIYGAGVLGNIQGVLIGGAIASGAAISVFIIASITAAEAGDVEPGTWMMGFPDSWRQLMPLETRSSLKSRQK